MDDAFGLLRDYARDSNQRLTDVARTFVASASADFPRRAAGKPGPGCLAGIGCHRTQLAEAGAMRRARRSGAAMTGTLQFFVGGDSAVLERCRPVLTVLAGAGRMAHVGRPRHRVHDQAAGEPAVVQPGGGHR